MSVFSFKTSSRELHLRPRWLAIVVGLIVFSGCNEKQTVVYYGGGTATIAIEPTGADGVSMFVSFDGSSVDAMKAVADAEAPYSLECATYAAISEGKEFYSELSLCPPKFDITRIGAGLCVDPDDTYVILGSDNAILLLDRKGKEADLYAEHPDSDWPYPPGISGDYTTLLNLNSECDEQVHEHRLTLTWAFDEEVSHTDRFGTGGGIPGVGG